MSPEEQERLERREVRGYCEQCEEWEDFIYREKATCSVCGLRFSTQYGYQITTQRTPLLKRKLKKK